MAKRFIVVTSAYPGAEGTKYILSVDGIGAIHQDDASNKKTRLKHSSHNNGGYVVSETPEQIMQLIKDSIIIFIASI